MESKTGYKTFTATATAISPYKRVKVDSNGLISIAAAADAAIGVTIEAIAISGRGTVKLFTGPGTFFCNAGAAITRGAQVFPAASGNISGTGTTALNLVALEAAASPNDVIECAPCLLGA